MSSTAKPSKNTETTTQAIVTASTRALRRGWADPKGGVHAADRYGRHGVRPRERRVGHGHDAWACVLLRRIGSTEELPGDHDAELHLDGSGDHHLGAGRILPGLLRERRRHHREPQLVRAPS